MWVNILKDVQESNKECKKKPYLHKLGVIYKVFLMSTLSYCQKDKNIKAWKHVRAKTIRHRRASPSKPG